MDVGRNLLLRYSTDAEIQTLQQRSDEVTAEIPTARAQLGLPGLGHSLENGTRGRRDQRIPERPVYSIAVRPDISNQRTYHLGN